MDGESKDQMQCLSVTPCCLNNFFVAEPDLRLVHLSDEGVDVVLTVTKVTTLDEVLELAGTETTSGVAELERPAEVGGLLEVGPDGVDLVDKIFHADNAVLAEVLLNEGVVCERNALLVDLSVTTLVDELTDSLQVGVTVGDEGLDDLEHLNGGLGEADEDTVVDLEKTEELEGLALLGVDLVDTLDTDHEGELGLSRDVVGSLLLGDTGKADLLALCVTVLLDVRLGTLEDDLALLLVGLQCNVSRRSKTCLEPKPGDATNVFQSRKMVDKGQHQPKGLVA